MRAEPKRLLQAPKLEVLSDPDRIQAAVRRTYSELGYLLDQDSSAALLADAVCKDCPIVGVTQGFVELTGFSRDSLLGKNCRVLLDGVPEVAISKSARKNLRDFCRMCLFVGLSQIAEATSLQPNARKDGSPFMNFFMVGLCQVDRHPFILGVQVLVGEGLLAKLSNKQILGVTEESRSTLLRLRRLLRAEQSLPLLPRPRRADGGFSFYGERLQDHCTLFDHNQRVVRREPHELATNCLVYGDVPMKWTELGLFFAVRVDDIVSTFTGLPLLGFTRRKPADVADLYPPVTKCMGSSVLIGACGEAFARDDHTHFKMGFRAPPSSEVQAWSLQEDLPNHKRTPPEPVEPGDELGCLYTRAGRLQLWRNGQKTMDIDVGRPPEVGADYYAVADVCFTAYSLTLISRPPPAEEMPGADAAGGAEVQRPTAASLLDSAAGHLHCLPGHCQRHSHSLALGHQDSCRSGCSSPLVAPRYISDEAAKRAITTAVAKCGFCVTVASPEGEVPLIAISEGFEEMTGYCSHEIVGKNCRFLNEGCFVSSQDLMGLRMSSATGAPFTALMPNRKKSGELFVNMLDLQGLAVARHSRTAEVLWYCVGIQADITQLDDEMIPERHAPQRQEVTRLIQWHLRQEATALGCDSPSHGSGPCSGTHGCYQLLEEPLWMHGSEWAQDCIALGTRPPTPIRLQPTMSPGSLGMTREPSMQKTNTLKSVSSPSKSFPSRDISRRSLSEKGDASVRSFSKAYSEKGDASMRSFSKAYSEKAALDERMPGRSLGLENSTSEGTICLLKGWFAFSVPALGTLIMLLASLLHRRWWQ